MFNRVRRLFGASGEPNDIPGVLALVWLLIAIGWWPANSGLGTETVSWFGSRVDRARGGSVLGWRVNGHRITRGLHVWSSTVQKTGQLLESA